MSLNFSDTEIAFKSKSNVAIKKAAWLFKSFNYPFIVQQGPLLAAWALKWHFPFIGSLVKGSIFSQFCGGETIEECSKTVNFLNHSNVKSILDYSVEGEENESNFDHTCREIIRTIDAAQQNSAIAFSVFKTTGIVRNALLEKLNPSSAKILETKKALEIKDYSSLLSPLEYKECELAFTRFSLICDAAAAANIRLFVDAEETWIQDTIDAWTEANMRKHNKAKAIIFNTVQMYRHDRVKYMKRLVEMGEDLGLYIGFKIVRGAYMEKERERALVMNYLSPIQPDKEHCDRDFDDALFYCIQNSKVAICCGTHNEESSLKLTKWMQEKGISNNDERIYFAQLLGMSDHISFNLAASDYNVAKYVPYGPVQAVLPYLARRAQENSSVKGQVGRELNLIKNELQRRNSN